MEFTPLIKKLDNIEYTNGNMPDDTLRQLSHNVRNNNNPYMYYQTKGSLERIIKYLYDNKIVNSNGQQLDFTLESGYRPLGKPGDYERLSSKTGPQFYLRALEANTGIDFGDDTTQYYTYELWLKEQKNFAMNPGTSMHGWGIAVDIYEYPKNKRPEYYGGGFIPGKSQKSITGPWKNGPIKQDEFQKWLKENGSKFGWTWKGLDYGEAWHFEYDENNDPSRGPKTTLETNNNAINFNLKPKELNFKRKVETITNKKKQEIVDWINGIEKKIK
jgi:hypothetical protein